MQSPFLHESFDVVVRLLPAGSILVAVWLANRQLRAARRATAVTIAKNHYRELLENFIRNADIVFAGTTPEGISELKKSPVDYRRYRWLANLTLFSLQELYFAIPDEKNWRSSIGIVSTIFKHFILSETELPPFIQAAWHPDFLHFVRQSIIEADHPILKIAAAEGNAALHMAFATAIGEGAVPTADRQKVSA